jgi:DNA-binding NtrC family response regulator
VRISRLANTGVKVSVPPLRNRQADVPYLTNHFACNFAERDKRNVRGITLRAMMALCSYQWPGNVRQLEHVVEVAVAMLGDRDIIDVSDLGLPTPETQVQEDVTTRPKHSSMPQARRGPRPKYGYDWPAILDQMTEAGTNLKDFWKSLPEPKHSYKRFCALLRAYVQHQS